MKQFVKRLSFLVLISFLACTGGINAFDPGLPDSVIVDSVVTFVSSGAVVPIRFINDEPLSAVEITITLPRTVATLDSFSFAGSRVEYISTRGVYINEDSSRMSALVSVTSEQDIPAGSGIFGRAYFSWPVTTSPQLLTIDSARWQTPTLIEHYTYFVYNIINEIHPAFTRGYIDIKTDPLRPDSLWVVSTEGTAGGSVSVDVSLFNEKDVKAIGLALEWGTDKLTLNSVTYDGTRGDAAVTKNLFTNGNAQMLAELEFADLAPLAPGTGVVARLNFSINPACPETTITIDTAIFSFIQDSYVRLTAADGSIEFMPLFRAGTIDVKTGTGVGDDPESSLPHSFSVDQNYPNPFNPTTEIRFSLPKASRVRVDIYDILGRSIRTLLDEPKTAGVHQVTFDGRSQDGSSLPTGVYFYRLVADGFSQSRKMLLLK